ncbi:MAG: hypothetical protein II230_07765, partial [Clostridia bacterium]|nr:hypothetical protein [Clostridia bacterium]
ERRVLRVYGIHGVPMEESEIEKIFSERREKLPEFKNRYTHGVLKRFTAAAQSPMKGGYME